MAEAINQAFIILFSRGYTFDSSDPMGVRALQTVTGYIPLGASPTWLIKSRARRLGRSIANCLQTEIGILWSWDEWRAARPDDLRTMPLEAFCDTPGYSMGAASQRRAAPASRNAS